MAWRIIYARRADRQLESLDVSVRERVLLALNRLDVEGHGDVVRIRGQNELWRLRVGDWRVMFSYEYHDLLIRVHQIQHRREVYRAS